MLFFEASPSTEKVVGRLFVIIHKKKDFSRHFKKKIFEAAKKTGRFLFLQLH